MSPVSPLLDRGRENDDNCSKDNGRISNSNGDAETVVCSLECLKSSCLKNISEIRLSGCSLTEIPDISVDAVSVLDLSHNKLTCLPSSFSGLNKVRILNLSHNDFEEPPKCLFQGMCLIKELDLSHNKLKNFNLAPLCISLLRVLKISVNLIDCAPLWLFHDISSSLLDVDLSVNQCVSVNLKSNIVGAETDKVCDSVLTMKLSNCGLNENNTSFLSFFSGLTFLDLSNYEIGKSYEKRKFKFPNMFNKIPVKSLRLLENLSQLTIQNVGLPSIEDDVSLLVNLKVLDISHNTVNWLPKGLCSLHNLEKLVASNCDLYFLPCDIGNLKNLKELYVNENQLASLPESCIELENLEVLDLYNNHFNNMPDVQIFRKLKAIDLSMNNFDLPHEIMVSQRISPYEELRGILHGYIRDFGNRLNERKETASGEDPSDSDGHETCDLDSHSWTESYSNCGNDCDEEEVWDCYSADSDDYFDPNVDDCHFALKSENLFSIPPSIKERKNYFCPCEESFQFWGTKKQFFHIAEGQFEDP